MELIQGCFIIPEPESGDSIYYLIHSKADIIDTVFFEMSDIILSKIRIIAGIPSIIFKDQTIVHDTLTQGKIAICRHANGRDWWILTGRKNDNRYYTMLLSNTGISIDTLQMVGDKVFSGPGQAGFAKGGTIYYRYEGFTVGDSGAIIHIYDFDRCTGLLSNHRWWYQPNYSLTGAAASPNGKYLYTTDANNIRQWDLEAADIEASGVIVATYDNYIEPNWFPTYFGLMDLGCQDHTIYG